MILKISTMIQALLLSSLLSSIGSLGETIPPTHEALLYVSIFNYPTFPFLNY